MKEDADFGNFSEAHGVIESNSVFVKELGNNSREAELKDGGTSEMSLLQWATRVKDRISFLTDVDSPFCKFVPKTEVTLGGTYDNSKVYLSQEKIEGVAPEASHPGFIQMIPEFEELVILAIDSMAEQSLKKSSSSEYKLYLPDIITMGNVDEDSSFRLENFIYGVKEGEHNKPHLYLVDVYPTRIVLPGNEIDVLDTFVECLHSLDQKLFDTWWEADGVSLHDLDAETPPEELISFFMDDWSLPRERALQALSDKKFRSYILKDYTRNRHWGKYPIKDETQEKYNPWFRMRASVYKKIIDTKKTLTVS